jgi:hypothetical protein
LNLSVRRGGGGQQDEGYPNAAVERLLHMDSDELSQDMDRTMEEA